MWYVNHRARYVNQNWEYVIFLFFLNIIYSVKHSYMQMIMYVQPTQSITLSDTFAIFPWQELVAWLSNSASICQINFRLQGSKRQLFKSRHEIHYSCLLIWVYYFLDTTWHTFISFPLCLNGPKINTHIIQSNEKIIQYEIFNMLLRELQQSLQSDSWKYLLHSKRDSSKIKTTWNISMVTWTQDP